MIEQNKKYSAIVAGTSAGGLHALSVLLAKIPSDYPVPIIIVQHRTKDQKELLEDVLQYKCKIKIKQADEKEKISGGTVYFAPPDYHLLIENDKTFSLSVDELIKYSRPSIDVLFETAAAVFRKELIGIILTGANSDGATGLKTIKNKGGLTIAQDPEEAAYPHMPTAAIENGGVKLIWPLHDIQKFLIELPSTTSNEKDRQGDHIAG